MSAGFEAARRAAVMSDLLAVLAGRPTDLLPFETVRRELGLRHLVDRGMRQVPLDRIVGTLGRGQKWAEEGAPVSAAARSPISVTGRIEGNKVILQFTERGAKRATAGNFSWTLAANGNALHGSFCRGHQRELGGPADAVDLTPPPRSPAPARPPTAARNPRRCC